MSSQLDTPAELMRKPASAELATAAKVAFVLIVQPTTRNVSQLVRQYQDVVSAVDATATLVVVANGLDSDSLRELSAVTQVSTGQLVWVELLGVCGPLTILRLALRQTSAERIVVLPATMRCHADDVRQLIGALDEFDYVGTIRRRRGVGRLRRLRTKAYNCLVERITGIELHDINSTLCGMQRQAIADLPLYGDLHLFIPVLAARQGFRVGEIEVSSPGEQFSDGPFRLQNYLRRMLDLFTLFFLTGFTEKPFRLFGSVGALITACGGILMTVLVVQRVLGQPLGNRPLLALAILLIVLGIQLLSLGLLGELIIFVNAAAMKSYHLKGHTADGRAAEDNANTFS